MGWDKPDVLREHNYLWNFIQATERCFSFLDCQRFMEKCLTELPENLRFVYFKGAEGFYSPCVDDSLIAIRQVNDFFKLGAKSRKKKSTAPSKMSMDITCERFGYSPSRVPLTQSQRDEIGRYCAHLTSQTLFLGRCGIPVCHYLGAVSRECLLFFDHIQKRILTEVNQPNTMMIGRMDGLRGRMKEVISKLDQAPENDREQRLAKDRRRFLEEYGEDAFDPKTQPLSGLDDQLITERKSMP